MHPAFTISQKVVAVSAERPVRAMRLRVADKVPPHDHEFCEICLVVSGQGTHLDASGRTPMHRGDVFITLPGEVHAISPVQGLCVWNIYYLAEWFMGDLQALRAEPRVLATFFSHHLFGPQYRNRCSHLRLTARGSRQVQGELLEISRETSRPESSALLLRGCFEKILHHLAAAVSADAVADAAVTREEVWLVLRRIDELLTAGHAFDPAVVSRGAHVGTDRLSRLFKQATGLTPFAYFQRRRLQLARRRLLNPDQSAAMIALSLGFADASHFGRDFRRQYGVTPRQFRLQFSGRNARPGAP